MNIQVKLYGDLRRHAPGDEPQFTLRLQPGAILEDIQRMLAVADAPHIALINGRRSTKEAAVADGDTLVLMPLISGG
ncbi:MAG: MoaD/ThiS family protein [Desulfobacterales bacterium]|jgi:molybdopterin converting factor small subunit